jgi:hypothetical protein
MSHTKPKGKTLTLACGHVIIWPRPVTSAGRIWCVTCDSYRKIESVR